MKTPLAKFVCLTAYEILAYLADNPQAGDSIEGIEQWWLMGPQRTRTTSVQTALDELVTKGFLLSRKALDGRVHYRLNPQKEEEVTLFRRSAQNG